MELALLLVLLVIVELAVTVWLLARHKSYLKRVSKLEKNLVKLAEVLKDYEQVPETQTVYNPAAPAAGSSLADLVSKATPEDLEQAHKILASMGFEG